MSVCPQVIDDKSYRRRIFNECVSEEFLKDEMWLGVFFGVIFSILLTIGIASNMEKMTPKKKIGRAHV